VLDLLQHGRPIQRLITVTEGMPSIIIGEKLAANQFLTGPTPPIGEGTVLPDSYGYERGEARAAIVRRMQAAMTKTLDQLVPKNSGKCPVSSRQDVVTLASIVEKETGKASERRMVAGVYCNRLRIGMKLDADPTVIYPITKGKPIGRRIRRSELMAQTGYNTYRQPGLPLGPIANPGRDSIAAMCSRRRSSNTKPMCSAGMRSAASAARCSSGAQRLGPHVTHQPVPACIAPGPAERVVKQAERIVRLEFRQLFGIVGRRQTKRRVGYHGLSDRRGIVGRYDLPREGDVRQVRTISVDLRIGRVRPSGKRESVSAGARRRAVVR